jgi:hypothetical protein
MNAADAGLIIATVLALLCLRRRRIPQRDTEERKNARIRREIQQRRNGQ